MLALQENGSLTFTLHPFCTVNKRIYDLSGQLPIEYLYYPYSD